MKRKRENPNDMDLGGHLRELRHRFLVVLVLFATIFIATYLNCNNILSAIRQMGEEIGYKLVYISPQEVIVQQFRLAGVASFLISLPIMIYQIVAFIAPVFSDKKPLRKILMYCIFAMVLFILGAAFAYKILLPFIYKFLFDIGIANNIEAQISIKEYISLFITIECCIGIVTEMPLISIILTKVGILTPKRMKAIRPYIIVAIFITAAIITPPDVVSQVMVAIPMIVLYQISIILCKLIKEEKSHGEEK